MSETFACTYCGKECVSRLARKRHNKKCTKNWRTRDDVQPKGMDPKTFSEIYDDLPDGAFFAMAEEFGLQPEDFR